MVGDETWLRLAVFFGLFLLLAIAERVIPRRKLDSHRQQRWQANLGMAVVGALLGRAAISIMLVGFAWLTPLSQQGLFGFLPFDGVPQILIGILLLDFAIWLQHVMSHHWNWLWKLHRVHHSDLAIDVSTALRFHPAEIVVSLAWKMLVIAIFGIPAMAVLLFEILLNAAAMFNHSNLKLPLVFDQILRKVLVTPDMHRVHHSTVREEQDRNFGFMLPWWDRLFGLYKAQPEAGHENMTIGLAQAFRQPADQKLLKLLRQPLD